MLKNLPIKRNHPLHINHKCFDCHTTLISFDEVWHDEWYCPKCQDGIHIDWTIEDFKKMEIHLSK